MIIGNMIDINIFSLLILGFIYVNTNKRAEHAFLQHRLFMGLAGTLAIILAADTISRLVDGIPGNFCLYLNWISNILLYLLVPVLPSIYLLYTDFHVYHDAKRFKKLLRPLLAFIMLGVVATLLNIFTGWIFTIDTLNVYHRGPHQLIYNLFCYIFLLYTFIFILYNKKRIDDRHFRTLLFFALPPAIGAFIQSYILGLALIWSGMTLSILLLYFNIQDRRLDTDYLTGAYNRRLLDSYLKDKIRLSTKNRTFSAILIDMNDFKEINDNLGHITGDDALLDAVGLLRGCLRDNDFIARYGGDEFLIVLDISRMDVLEEAVARIKNSCTKFNQSNTRPYTLSFSTGYAIYDPASGLDTGGFLRHIDKLMYIDKRSAAKI